MNSCHVKCLRTLSDLEVRDFLWHHAYDIQQFIVLDVEKADIVLRCRKQKLRVVMVETDLIYLRLIAGGCVHELKLF